MTANNLNSPLLSCLLFSFIPSYLYYHCCHSAIRESAEQETGRVTALLEETQRQLVQRQTAFLELLELHNTEVAELHRHREVLVGKLDEVSMGYIYTRSIC